MKMEDLIEKAAFSDWTESEVYIVDVAAHAVLEGKTSQRAVVRQFKELSDQGRTINGIKRKSVNAFRMFLAERVRLLSHEEQL